MSRRRTPHLLLALGLTAAAAGLGAAGADAGLAPGVALGATPARQAPGRVEIATLTKRFVISAVARRNVGSSYDLVTEGMKGGRSRAEWAAGDIPVIPLAAHGSVARAWIYEQTGDVAHVILLLTPPAGEAGVYPPVDVGVRRVDGRWLVDSFTLFVGRPELPDSARLSIPFLDTHDLSGEPIASPLAS